MRSPTSSRPTAPTSSEFRGRRADCRADGRRLAARRIAGWRAGLRRLATQARRRVTTSSLGALGRHIALVGFMGAGTTTVGREIARLTARPFVDLDEEIGRRHGPVPRIFSEEGEAVFRRLESEELARALASPVSSVIALGGGAIGAHGNRELLTKHGAFVAWLDVDAEEAWKRTRGGGRPLAADHETFHRLYARRRPIYEEVADVDRKSTRLNSSHA